MKYVCVFLLSILMAAILTGGAVLAKGKGTKGVFSYLLRAEMLAARRGIACVMIPAKTTHRYTFIVNFLREIPLIWYYCIF